VSDQTSTSTTAKGPGDDKQELAQEYAANLPAAPGTTPEPVVIGERRGMFGASSGQDTTGYGGLRSEILLPGASSRPYGGYYDQVADSLERALVGDGARAWLAKVSAGTVGRFRPAAAPPQG